MAFVLSILVSFLFLLLGVIGRLCSVTVDLAGHILYHLNEPAILLNSYTVKQQHFAF